ncbi:MAG: hypothetical protein JNK82_33935, partial [Myxococcaceae bacterium]|nr:hypothetical protein [Myxococcaceae bacterium]
MRVVALLVLGLGLAACDGGQSPPNPPAPPQVHLSAAKLNVVGTSFTVKIRVTGCEIVQALELEQGKIPFKNVTYRGDNTEVVVVPGDIARFYGAAGIAANLSLTARAYCNDARENRSSPLAIKFFPVQSSIEPSMGRSIMMPDSFVAEGGVGTTPVTFLGCANIGGALGLARVNTSGDLAGDCPCTQAPCGCNMALPFGCNYFASISDKVAGNYRWLYQPGAGAFAFDVNMNITGGITHDAFKMFVVGPDGDALVWDSSGILANNALKKVRHNSGVIGDVSFGAHMAWQTAVQGIQNGPPVHDNTTGLFLIPMWKLPGDGRGIQNIVFVNYMTGQVTGEKELVRQKFEFLDLMYPPQVGMSPDARTVYISVPILDQPTKSKVIACGTQGMQSGCQQRWSSPVLDDVILYIIPFAAGSKIAAISQNKVWFLEESNMATAGSVLNPSGVPTLTSGQLLVNAIQTGRSSDFYLLNAPPQPDQNT